MTSLVDKMRARRESWVKAGKFEFKLRRPTRLEIAKTDRDISAAELFIPHVHDWKNVVEDDLIGGGGTSAMPFERDAWAEFIADHSELWPPLMDAFTNALQEYHKQLEDREKN